MVSMAISVEITLSDLGPCNNSNIRKAVVTDWHIDINMPREMAKVAYVTVNRLSQQHRPLRRDTYM